MGESGSRDEAWLDRVVRDHGLVITTPELLKAGLSPAAVKWARRKGRLHSLRRGTYTSSKIWTEAPEATRHALQLHAHQRIHPDLVACGLSAATVLRLPLPDGPPPEPQLTVPRAVERLGGGGRQGGLLARRSWLDRSEVRRTREGLQITSPERTVIDCARELPAPWGLAMADAALAKYKVKPEALLAVAAAQFSAPGSRRALWVAENARPEVESPLESLARAHIVLAGLPEPVPQVKLKTRAGTFRVDLLDEANHLITEADGKLKYTTPEDLWKEKRREDALREEGFAFMRFAMADHHHPEEWLAAYRRALARSV